MYKFFKNIYAIIIYPRIYLLGRREAYSTFGITWIHPDTLKSIAYDTGRNHAEVD